MTAWPAVDRPARANVLGVGISALDLGTAVSLMVESAKHKTKAYVCVTGVHGVSEAQGDIGLRKILNEAFLNTPDGMPMVWMGRYLGFRQIQRVYGPDLMFGVCQATAPEGLKHFLYGGGPGVAEDLKHNLERRVPGLRIVGTYTPPFRPLNKDEEKEVIRRVATLKPDFFWVGLSTPKQEKFMAQYWQRLDATVFCGVGAAFDFHAGRLRQAPTWMQRSGLEWLFRLYCEPRRLWKRYLKNNPLFVGRALGQMTGIRRYHLDG